jgi:hypothetical protein
VLHESYGYRPVYFCLFQQAKLLGVLPVMEVNRPWSGIHGISLPFTDFCDPLFGNQTLKSNPYELPLAHGRQNSWKSFQSKGHDGVWEDASRSLRFYGHFIYLSQSTDALFRGLRGSVRRCIKKAQSSHLRVEFGHGTEAMRSFYDLHCKTRRRHGVPPQPFRFFDSITRNILALGKGVVVTVLFADKPIAAAVFCFLGRNAMFKFGASDYLYQRFRPNDLVMWEAMKWLRDQGCLLLHLGRTSLNNQGLRRFKRGFGAEEEELVYRKYDFRKREFVMQGDYSEGIANHVLRRLPLPVLRLLGGMLYPHIG